MDWYKSGDNFYFNDHWKQHLLKEELTSWLGTPYRHWSGVKGRGVDCAHLVERVVFAVGVTGGRSVVMPKYNYDWHLHRDEQFMRKAFETQYNCYKLFTPESLNDWNMNDFMDGDVILFKYGFQPAHAAIHMNGSFYQALTGMGVEFRSIHDKEFKSRMQYGYRFKVVGS